jgi:hypothetical protein
MKHLLLIVAAVGLGAFAVTIPSIVNAQMDKARPNAAANSRAYGRSHSGLTRHPHRSDQQSVTARDRELQKSGGP